MVLFGLVILVVGYLMGIGILVTIGWILVIVGVVLALLGMIDRPVAGRKHWW